MTLLKYDVAIVGAQNIDRVLAGIERRYAQHNARVRAQIMRDNPGLRTAGRGSSRAGAEDRELAQLERRLQRDLRAQNRARERDEKRAAQVLLRDQQKAEREAVASAQRAERDKTRAAEQGLRERTRFYRQESRALEREERKRQSDAAKAFRDRRQFFRNVTTGGINAVGRGVGRVTNTALAFGGMAGAALVYGGLQSAREKGAMTADLANQAFGTPEAMGKSREQLQREISATSRAVGKASFMPSQNVTGSMSAFVGKGGTIDAAHRLAPFFADVADASGSDIQDVGESAGALFATALAKGMTSPEAEQVVRDAIAGMAGQAKAGSIELKDLAGVGARLFAASSRFSGGLGGLVNTMGAVGQLSVAGGAAGPEEAMSALANFANQVSKKGGDPRGAFVRNKVDVFTDKSKTMLRDPADIIMDAISKTKGSLPELAGMFDAEAMRAVEPFRQAFIGAGGGDKGIEAMRAQFDRFRKLAETPESLSESASFRRQQDDRQFDAAMDELKTAVGDNLLPALTELAPKLKELVPIVGDMAQGLVKVVNFFKENPVAGIGLLIGASITAEIAKAGISGAITAAITKLFPTTPPVPGAPPVVPPVGGGAGAAGAGAAAGGMSPLLALGGALASVASGWQGVNMGERVSTAMGTQGTASDYFSRAVHGAAAASTLGLSEIPGLIGLPTMERVRAEKLREEFKGGIGSMFGAQMGALAPYTPKAPDGAPPGAMQMPELKVDAAAFKPASDQLSASARALDASAQALNAAASAMSSGGGGGGAPRRSIDPTVR